MGKKGSRGPKHRQIADCIRDEVLSGKHPEGGLLPSEVELVKRFAVSRPTVGRALRDLQNEGLIDRRAGAGTFVRRNATVRGGLWGLIIPGLGNTEIFEPICAEMARLAQQHDFSLLWGGATREGLTPDQQAVQLCAQCLERKVAGVFFVPLELTPQKDEVNARIADALRQARIPIVLLDRDLYDFPRRSEYDIVGIDNVAAGYVVTEHLLAHGCRNLRFVARPLSAATVDMRIAGFREALARHGAVSPQKQVCIGDPADQSFVAVLAKQADACVCANDHTAALLMRGLDELGLRVPRDVRVVGFDDTKYATLLSVPLTTMHQPCPDIGAAAVQAMLERIRTPSLPARQIMLQAELVVRESCGAKKAHHAPPRSMPSA